MTERDTVDGGQRFRRCYIGRGGGTLRRRDCQSEVWSFVASMALHGLAVALLAAWGPAPKPPPKPLEVQLLSAAVGPTPRPGPPRGVENPPPPSRPSRPRSRTAPPPAPTAPLAPGGLLPSAPSPRPAPQRPSPPTSFRDWQQSTASRFLPPGLRYGEGGGGEGETGGEGPPTRDRCQPEQGRTFATLFLLFDSSGSMDPIRRAQALSCAHQYAKAAIEAGAPVVIGNFARGTVFTGPTRSLEDVEIAIRGSVDGSATILPSAELEPFLNRDPAGAAELVIVSDGMFGFRPQLLDWYRSFLARNPGNHATMYTVGSPGHGESVAELRGAGLDVFLYEQIRH